MLNFMCGIMAYVGQQNCADFLVNGLRLLEYRGYDSAGIACSQGVGKTFEIVKAEGKLENIERLLKNKHLLGTVGIGHTRWATHGKPNTINAHPHRAGATVLVHNGIIENYEQIRDELTGHGYKMVSETDSELFGHLVEDQMKKGLEFEEAVRTAFLRLEGSCSIVVSMTGIRIRSSPCAPAPRWSCAFASRRLFCRQRCQAVLEHTNVVTYLEFGDVVVCEEGGFRIFDVKDSRRTPLRREAVTLDWTLASMDKAGFAHYMLKEIHEQPRAILDTLDNLVDRDAGTMKLQSLEEMVRKVSKIQIIACGSAWHAALIGKYILENEARIAVEVDLASEYRYRKPIVGPDTLVLAISQSGETAVTLAALREAKRLGSPHRGDLQRARLNPGARGRGDLVHRGWS